MSLDRKSVMKIAYLARIHVPEEEQDTLAEELSKVMHFVEQLNEVDTSDVVPMTSVVDMSLRWRSDVVEDGEKASDILANAPSCTQGYFIVPKVI